MIRISERQKQHLAEEQQRAFYTDLVAFFRAEDPALFQTLSDDQALHFAHVCHQRCEQYGLRMAASVYAWADFSILLGSHFYRDPFYLGLMLIINRSSPFSERETMLEAQDWVTHYLKEVRGETNEFATAALRRVHEFHQKHPAPDKFHPPAPDQFEGYMTDLSVQIHPELAAYHGRDVVQRQVQHNLSYCQSYYGLNSAWHKGFMTLMSLSFGAGFDVDELYPWMRKPLGRAKEIGAEAAVEKLAKRTSIWVENVLNPRGDET